MVWEANESYPVDPARDGMQSIDGFLVEVKDWASMARRMHFDQGTLSGKRTMNERVLIVDPALDLAIRGNQVDKYKMFKTDAFDPKFKAKIEEISTNELLSSNVKLDRVVNDGYPLLDARTVRDLIQIQLDAKADFVVPPVVPITSSRQIEKQVTKAKEMIKQTHVYMDTVFNRYKNSIDIMNLITINASVLNADNYNHLLSLALTLSPDHIGIRLVNFATSNDSQMRSIAAFLNQLSEAMKINDLNSPLHMINFDHLGYTTYCLGAQTVTMPIAIDPYFYSRGHSGEDRPEDNGAYYRMKDMSYVRHNDLRMELAEDNYRLPCDCEACEGRTILEIDEKHDWNRFRRLHEILARDIEIKQFRDSKIPPCRAIQDQLALLGS